MLKRLTISTTLIGAALLPITALAADSGTVSSGFLGMTPIRQEFDVASGGSTFGNLTVINDSNSSSDVVMGAEGYKVKGEDYQAVMDNEALHAPVGKWIVFDKPSLTLAPHSREQIGFHINVPAGVASGGNYALAYAEASTQGGGSINIKRRVASIFYITVEGNNHTDESIKSWDVPFWQIGDPLKTSLRLANNGNIHYKSEVQTVFSDFFGNKKYTLNKELFVLPSTIRHEPFEWAKAPTFGLYKVSGTVNFGDKTEPLPAKYVLMLNATAFVIMFIILALIAAISISVARRANR